MKHLEFSDLPEQLVIPILKRNDMLSKNVNQRISFNENISAAGIGRTSSFSSGEIPVEKMIRRLIPHIERFEIPKYPKDLDLTYLSLLRIPKPELVHKFDAVFPINEVDVFSRYLAILEFFTNPYFEEISSKYGTGQFFATFDKITEQKRAIILTKLRRMW